MKYPANLCGAWACRTTVSIMTNGMTNEWMRSCQITVSGANENGLRGRSGDLGLSALANRSSPESALDVRVIVVMDANPLLWSLLFCCAWMDSGG